MEEIMTYVNTIKEATDAVYIALSKLLREEREVAKEMSSGSEHYASLGIIQCALPACAWTSIHHLMLYVFLHRGNRCR